MNIGRCASAMCYLGDQTLSFHAYLHSQMELLIIHLSDLVLLTLDCLFRNARTSLVIPTILLFPRVLADH